MEIENMENLEEKLNDISNKLSEYHLEMKEYIARQESICLNHRSQSEKLSEAVNGNGKIGIKDRVLNLENRMGFLIAVVLILAPFVVGLIGHALWVLVKTAH